MDFISAITSATEHASDKGWIGWLVVYLMLRRDMKKFFEKAKPGMLDELRKVMSDQVQIIKASIDVQVGKLVSAIEGHNARLGILENDVGQIKKKLDVGPTPETQITTTQGG